MTKLNKTQLIREALIRYPELKPKQLAAMLNRHHCTNSFTASHVSMTKFYEKKKEERPQLEQLQQVLVFIKSVGGLKKAESLIQDLKGILNKFPLSFLIYPHIYLSSLNPTLIYLSPHIS